MTAFSEALPFWIGKSAQVLGWRPAEFWQATPAELIGAISTIDHPGASTFPSRDLVNQMLEREGNG